MSGVRPVMIQPQLRPLQQKQAQEMNSSAIATQVRNMISPAPKKRNRIAISTDQQRILSEILEIDAFPSKTRRSQLASELGLDPKTIQIWFQNQRQKVRKSARERRRSQEALKEKHMQTMMAYQAWSMGAGAAASPSTGVGVNVNGGMVSAGGIAPPASPKLKYSGPEKSDELNALVDAAMEELTKTFVQIASSLSSSPQAGRKEKGVKKQELAPLRHEDDTKQQQLPSLRDAIFGIPMGEKETPQQDQTSMSPKESLLRMIPAGLLKSPKFRTRSSRSTMASPRLKTLQPRSQPNTSSEK